MLPVVPLPTTTVEVDGKSVDIRSLSRAEVLVLFSLDGLEEDVYALVKGANVTEEQAKTWLDTTDNDTARALIREILRLSRLLVEKDGADPQA